MIPLDKSEPSKPAKTGSRPEHFVYKVPQSITNFYKSFARDKPFELETEKLKMATFKIGTQKFEIPSHYHVIEIRNPFSSFLIL